MFYGNNMTLLRVMGFETELITKAVSSTLGAGASAAKSILSSQAQKQAARNAKAVSDHNQEFITSKANIIGEETTENSLRMRQEANRKMGEARTDAGSSSVVTDGSIAMRDIDLATRLETEILDSMRSGFNQANNLKQEGRTRKMTNQARINGYKTNAGSTLLSGFDTTVSQTSDASLGWYKYYDALSKREQGK